MLDTQRHMDDSFGILTMEWAMLDKLANSFSHIVETGGLLQKARSEG